MNLADLNKVALALVAPGKGVLAADESTGTGDENHPVHGRVQPQWYGTWLSTGSRRSISDGSYGAVAQLAKIAAGWLIP